LDGLSAGSRLGAAVVDGEFLEIREEGQRQVGRPGVAAKLVGGRHFLLDVDRGLLGLEEEDAPAADAEAVVRRLGRAADLDGVLVDDFAEGFGVILRVVDVPAERA
jgi:hypothetical protein